LGTSKEFRWYKSTPTSHQLTAIAQAIPTITTSKKTFILILTILPWSCLNCFNIQTDSLKPKSLNLYSFQKQSLTSQWPTRTLTCPLVKHHVLLEKYGKLPFFTSCFITFQHFQDRGDKTGC
jgi:hypothetical protein